VFCGDGNCDASEDQCDCADDCGTPPDNESICDDGIDNDCDLNTDCEDPDCADDSVCFMRRRHRLLFRRVQEQRQVQIVDTWFGSGPGLANPEAERKGLLGSANLSQLP
jgi:hypothetical protein